MVGCVPLCRNTQNSNNVSYFWDELIQKTCQNALNGSLLGNGDVFKSEGAIPEMAKEPRFSRRALSENIISAIKDFPENIEGISRKISFMPSFYKETGYVFLQLRHPNITDYENIYRPQRQAMLEIACGVAKNKFSYLKKIIGIAIDAPKFTDINSEDFLLLNCEDWSEEQKRYYEKQNVGLQFFNQKTMKRQIRTVKNFPDSDKVFQVRKIGRNEKCPCGSGKKYKKCCL